MYSYGNKKVFLETFYSMLTLKILPKERNAMTGGRVTNQGPINLKRFCFVFITTGILSLNNMSNVLF